MTTFTTPTTRRVLRELYRSMNPEVWTPNNIILNGVNETPSPDEQIIRLRGRRIFVRSPVKSPRKDQTASILSSPRKTPKKSPSKYLTSTPTRCSPRKRLLLSPTDSPVSNLSPVKINKPFRKRIKWHLADSSSIQSVLPALSQTQLVDLIHQIIETHPEVEEEIRKKIPPPDLSAMDTRLENLKHNIFVSFPKCRWGSRQDSFSFHRVSTHVEIFKKECIQMGRHLVEVGEWLTVIEYVAMAWPYIVKLPDWENPSHNKPKQQCFRLLAGQCLKALQMGKFNQEQVEDIFSRLKELEKNKDLETCLKYIEKTYNLS